MLGIFGAVLRERACQRGLLLLERVLLTFVVELDEDLPRLHPIARSARMARTVPSASDDTVT
jgi:hypothetical protein